MTKKLPFKTIQHQIPEHIEFFKTRTGCTCYISKEVYDVFIKRKDIEIELMMGYVDSPQWASDILWADYVYQTTGELPK